MLMVIILCLAIDIGLGYARSLSNDFDWSVVSRVADSAFDWFEGVKLHARKFI